MSILQFTSAFTGGAGTFVAMVVVQRVWYGPPISLVGVVLHCILAALLITIALTLTKIIKLEE